MLGLTTRRVHQYVTDGVFPKVKRGTYNVSECVQAYVEYMIRTKQAELGSIDREELRVKKAQADIKEHQYNVLTGKYADAELVHEIYRDAVLNLKTKLLQLPRRLSLINLPSGPREREIIMRTELHDAMKELDAVDVKEEDQEELCT